MDLQARPIVCAGDVAPGDVAGPHAGRARRSGGGSRGRLPRVGPSRPAGPPARRAAV